MCLRLVAFLDENRKYCIHYFFVVVVSITLVVIQIKVIVLILYDIPNDLQVPSNLSESFMH